MKQDAVTVGVVSDGKPGHLNQSLGLAEALRRQRPHIDIKELPTLTPMAALGALLRADAPAQHLDLLIAAGHGTHLTLLAERRRSACPAIVLMRPSLPARFFDLCIQPRHDGGAEGERIWLSDGPLNRMQPGEERGESGVILLGGPSPHFSWDGEILLRQLAEICDGSRLWELSGSRRTPHEFLDTLRAMTLPGLTVHAADALPASWLGEQLPNAGYCWVTPDSASMVYEALSAGCAVGLFDLPGESSSRVAAAVASLAERGILTRYSDFANGKALAPPRQVFAEADRLAGRILKRGWL